MILNYSTIRELSDTNSYNSKIVKKCIIIIQKSSDEHLKCESKTILLRVLSSVVQKNIENFFYLLRSYENIIHTRDDMVSESYMVMESCLKSYDPKMGKQFYLYFNKSLTRAFVRIIEKYYFKHRMSSRMTKKDEYSPINFTSPAPDFVEYYFKSFRLSDDEINIAKSKLSKQKIDDFLLENPGMSVNRYFNGLNRIRDKMKPIVTEK